MNLAKVIFMLKHLVKLRRYMLFGDVAACHKAACAQHTPLCDMPLTVFNLNENLNDFVPVVEFFNIKF